MKQQREISAAFFLLSFRKLCFHKAKKLRKFQILLISHNTEMLVYDGNDYYTCPVVSENLSGRTGRGDTVFASYVAEREKCGIQEALQYATALVSLKMETPGPYKGTRNDVFRYIEKRYQ